MIVASLAAVAGCGGKSQVDQSQLGNQAGRSSNGEAGNAGSVGAGGAGVGGAGAGGAGAGGQSAICASFVDAKPLSIPVLIENDLKFPIHLGPRTDSCAETPLFLVQDPSGTLLRDPGPCRTPCDSLLAGDPIGGCPGVCPTPKAVTLEPGESISVDWAGLFGVAADLPSQCIPKRPDGLEFGSQCEHSRAIAAGSYTFSAQAGTTLDCSEVLADGCYECEPDADGLCTVPYAVVGGATLTARAVVAVEARIGHNDSVKLVFKD
ncbi:MAG: hypothetical protein WDO74_29695 [Pseudomonadota bacterium]